MFNRIAATALAGCLVLAVPPPLKAQTEPAPGPYEATLDKLLANRDFAGLTRAALHDVTEQEPAMRALNWLQDQQIAHGGSVYIALLYSALLWKVSESVPEPQRQSLAQTAGASLLAARLMILSEGFQCADPSLLPDFAPFRDWKAERRAALDRLAQGSGVEPLTDYGDAQTRLK